MMTTRKSRVGRKAAVVVSKARTLGVRFTNSHHYGSHKTYNYMFDGDAAVGQYAIVDSPYGGYTCVKIVEVHDGYLPTATKRVIQLVDDTAYKMAQEADAKRAALRCKLKKLAAEANEEALWVLLAKTSPTIASALAELRAI